MQLPSTAKRYCAETGEEIIRIPYDPDRAYYHRDFFSDDGTMFFPFVIGSRRTSGDNEEGRFVIPHFDVKGSYRADQDTFVVEGVVYRPEPIVDPVIFVVPLAGHRRTEYIFVDGAGRLYYVDCPENNWNYSDFRLFVGLVGELREVKIDRVDRYRDGGTTFIRTAEGELYSPTPFNKGLDAHWTPAGATEVDDVLPLTPLVEGETVRITRLFSGGASIFGGILLEFIEQEEAVPA